MLSRVVIIVGIVLLAVFAGRMWFKARDGVNLSGAPTTEIKRAPVTLYIVNVLDKNLYDDAHIEGSIHVPFEEVIDRATTWDKHVPVVFYCSNYKCSASGEAARMLQDMGFEQVYAYEGGTTEWFKLAQTDSSYKIKGLAQQAYLNQPNEPVVHPESDIHILTASELHDMIEAAHLHEHAG